MESHSILDRLQSTLYSLNSLRARKLIEQFLRPPANLNFDLHGRGVFFVSNQCNLHCVYCKGLDACIVPPNLEEFESVLKHWRERKLRYLHLTGLEPTVSPWIIEYLKIAQKYQFEVSISTNGYENFERYLELVQHGVKYFSISLDAHNETVTQLMGGKPDIYAKVSANIRQLVELKREYDIKIVICLAITKVNFRLLPEIVADFLHHLHPDDIRLIPVAQEVFTPEDREYYAQIIQPQLLKLATDQYPFLRYRIDNFFTVRGLQNTSVKKCYVALDERTVGGKDMYPCNIYIRERGSPITTVTDPHQNEKIWRWFLNHNCLKDPICAQYCCDVTREYNLLVENSVVRLMEQRIFQPPNLLEFILHEEPIQQTFQQFQQQPLGTLPAHLMRTALNAGYLGMSLNWHFLTIYYLMRSALLHDIGKSHYAIRHLNEIHQPLDTQKKLVFREHTVYGKEILSQMGYPVEADIALHHHERVDGSGYRNIKLNWQMAEVVALSDVYSALTEERNGREQFSPAESVDMIHAGKCGAFRDTHIDVLRHCQKSELLC